MSLPINRPAQGLTNRDHLLRVRALEALSDDEAMYEIKVFPDNKTVSVGDGKFIWAIPEELNEYLFRSAASFVSTAGGDCTVMIRNITTSNDVLLTPITIDAGDFTSYPAGTQPVIDPDEAEVATGDLMSVDVDAAGGTKGLGVMLRLSR